LAYKEYRNCPYCDQTIERRARTCKHCRSALVDKTAPQIYDSTEESPDDERVTLEVKCPQCNAYIPKDAPTCEYCRGRGFGRAGKANFRRGFTIRHSGCSINSCGCLLPLLLLLLIILAATGGC